MSSGSPDALVVGGGVVGASVAYHLAREGVSVTLLERGGVAEQASGAAAGMLLPLGEAHAKGGAFLRCSLRSLEAFSELVPELAARSGVDPELEVSGALHVACDDARAEALRAKANDLPELGGVWLDAAAARAGARPDSFAAVQQFRFDRDMAALGVGRPAHEPRAHNHVRHVVTLAAALVEVGAAYVVEGTVWFRGAAVPARAGLGDAAAAALAGEFGQRFGDPAAEHPADVPVWRPSVAGEAAWPSPWGEGRPGWHAECAAMALTVLGPALDLHAGGADLRFPHHAYTAAMAEAVTDEMLDAIAIYGNLEEARQRLSARTHLPQLCFSSPPSFLVSNRRRALYARGSIQLFGSAVS